MRTPWCEIEPLLRDRAYRRIADLPELLLETDSWFTVDADLYYARLLGFDDEIVQDGLRLASTMPEIRVPVVQRWMVRDMREDVNPMDLSPTTAALHVEPDPIRVAVYRLQSCFVTLSVSAELYDVPVDKLPPNHQPVVAFLRYRRRS